MGNDFKKLPGVHHKGLDRSLYEGTFEPPVRIRDRLSLCPGRSPLDYGFRAHRWSWKSDYLAVCRDCGGYHEEEK